jgi:hypothetical protein
MTDLRNLTTRPAPTLERGEDWREQAACLGHEALFDHVIDCPSDADAEAQALALCVSCPAMELCRDALLGLEHGVVGGLAARERRALRRGRRPAAGLGILTNACAACGAQFTTPRGLATHWAGAHASLGKCSRGHEWDGIGPCAECRTQRQAGYRVRAS